MNRKDVPDLPPQETIVAVLPDLVNDGSRRILEEWIASFAKDGMSHNLGTLDRGFDPVLIPKLFPGISRGEIWKAEAVMVGAPLPIIRIVGDNCISKVFRSTNELRWAIAEAHGSKQIDCLDFGGTHHHLSYLFAARSYEMARVMCRFVNNVPNAEELTFP